MHFALIVVNDHRWEGLGFLLQADRDDFVAAHRRQYTALKATHASTRYQLLIDSDYNELINLYSHALPLDAQFTARTLVPIELCIDTEAATIATIQNYPEHIHNFPQIAFTPSVQDALCDVLKEHPALAAAIEKPTLCLQEALLAPLSDNALCDSCAWREGLKNLCLYPWRFADSVLDGVRPGLAAVVSRFILEDANAIARQVRRYLISELQ